MADKIDPLEVIRSRFLSRLAEQRSELERLSGNAEGNRAIADISHKIAGIAGSLGFPELSQAANQTELLLIRESTADIRASDEFGCLISRIAAALERGNL